MAKFEDVYNKGTKYQTPNVEETSLNKKRVGAYIIGKTIGEGAFAKVRLAVHVLSRERVMT